MKNGPMCHANARHACDGFPYARRDRSYAVHSDWLAIERAKTKWWVVQCILLITV
jgi:hypothetical protein